MKSSTRWVVALVMLVIICLTSGCADRIYWHERREPTTEAEGKAVAEHVEKVMSHTKLHLSGNDQDWDDVIAQAHKSAKETICRPTMWEWKVEGFPRGGYGWTGRWKYSEQLQIKHHDN